MKSKQSADELCWNVIQLSCRLRAGLGKSAETHGLSSGQAYALCLLHPNESVPMSALSTLLACDASNVTGIVDRLLAAKYIKKEEKQGDRRVKLISLTNEGFTVRKSLLQEIYYQEAPFITNIIDSVRP